MLALLLAQVALAATPPPLPVPEARVKYTQSGVVEDLTPAEVATRIAADPNARHLVWTPGMTTWAPAEGVPAVAEALAARGGLPVRLKYTADGTVLDLTAEEIATRVEAVPDGRHLAWKRGLTAWVDARALPEVARVLASRAPGAPAAAVAPAPATRPAGPVAVESADVTAAIRGHLAGLDVPTVIVEPAPLLPIGTAPGEGDQVLYEPPPLPGESTVILLEEIPPEEVEAYLKREGLK